jgi:hypothetical protein
VTAKRKLQAVRDLTFHMHTDLDLGYALSLGLVFWVDALRFGCFADFHAHAVAEVGLELPSHPSPIPRDAFGQQD